MPNRKKQKQAMARGSYLAKAQAHQLRADEYRGMAFGALSAVRGLRAAGSQPAEVRVTPRLCFAERRGQPRGGLGSVEAANAA